VSERCGCVFGVAVASALLDEALARHPAQEDGRSLLRGQRRGPDGQLTLEQVASGVGVKAEDQRVRTEGGITPKLVRINLRL